MSGFLTEKRTSGSMTERVPVPIRDDEAQLILGNQDQNVDNPVETEDNFEVGNLSRSQTVRFQRFQRNNRCDRGRQKQTQSYSCDLRQKNPAGTQLYSSNKRITKIMAKEVTGFIKLQIKGGAANPAPPVGPALGSKGSTLWTSASSSMQQHKTSREKIFRSSSRFTDKSFTSSVKQPPVAIHSRKLPKLQKGSGEPNSERSVQVTWDQVRRSLKARCPDMNAFTLASAMKMVAGTARSMGIKVTGKFPRTFNFHMRNE